MAEAHKLLRQDRVNFICPADYRPEGPMFKVVTTIIDKIKSEYDYNLLQRSIKNKNK